MEIGHAALLRLTRRASDRRASSLRNQDIEGNGLPAVHVATQVPSATATRHEHQRAASPVSCWQCINLRLESQQRVKLRRTQCERMFSALPSNADIHHDGRHVAEGPIPLKKAAIATPHGAKTASCPLLPR
jgi:hypothetical protein